jgi:HEAT repeat protein
MEQVVKQLSRDEPQYERAAQLGPEALPHLIALIQGEDLNLATKAASLAGNIDAAQSAAVLELAARHPEPVVRVAAAASARKLPDMPTSLALMLLNDPDAGVRKWALRSLEVHHPAGIRERVQEIMTTDPDAGLRERAKEVIDELP